MENFLQKMPDKLKAFLDCHQIYGVNMCFYTDIDEKANFTPIYFIVANGFFYKIKLEEKSIEKYSGDKTSIRRAIKRELDEWWRWCSSG